MEIKAYKTSLSDTFQQSSTNKRKNVKTKVVENIKSSSKTFLPGSYPSQLGHKTDNSSSTNTCQIGNLPGSYPGLDQIQRQISSQKYSNYCKSSQKQVDKHSFAGNAQNVNGRVKIWNRKGYYILLFF